MTSVEHIVTIAMGLHSCQDLKVLMYGLNTFQKPVPHLYVLTDTESIRLIREIPYDGDITIKIGLDQYSGMNRKQMEGIKGVRYKTKWTDFMAEKIFALRWVFQTFDKPPRGIWFLDSDITLFNSLPSIPEGTEVALSPHYIRPGDEAKYGRYNGGFLWLADMKFLDVWETATHTARFFEQSALEDVAKSTEHLYEFPIQVNFGWWRLWQSLESPESIQKKFGFNRTKGIGLTFQDEPLNSVHTHWAEIRDPFTKGFNDFIKGLLGKLGKHKAAQDFSTVLRKTF